jgi:hypothetical protein
MTGGWEKDDGFDIIRKNKGLIIRAIEKKMKLYLRMGAGDAKQGLIGEIPYAFEFVPEQEACIDSYSQL